MNHEELQRDFYRDFDNSYVNNWHINSDHLADEAPVFRSLKDASESDHSESVRKPVRIAQIVKENQQTAKQLGVTNDDIH